MESVSNTFGNVTFLSVLSLIFVQQDYRTINILNEEAHSEVSNKIMEIASRSLKPFNHFETNDLKTTRNECKGLILNILIVNNISEPNNINYVRENIFPDDVTIILLNPVDDNNDNLIKFHFQRWMQLSIRVMILTKSLFISLNVLQHEKEDKINLTPFNATLVLQFVENYFSNNFLQQGTNLTIYFQFSAPKSYVVLVGNDYIFNGPDGVLAETLTKRLNATTTFCSDFGITYPDYVNWGNDPIIGSRLHFQYYYMKLLTKNVVSIFNKSLRDDMDLHMSAFPVNEKEREQKSNLKTERLYPHDKGCLVVMVPKQTSFDHFLQKITKNSDIQSICIAMLLFTVVRIIIEKSSWNQWISIFIKSLGILLNQGKFQNDNGIQAAWEMNLRGFSVLATIAMSVITYKNIITMKYVEIDTIDDLVASNLSIYAPDYLEKDALFWSNLKPDLRKKISFRTIEAINRYIIEKRKYNYAYVFIDTSAEYMDMLIDEYTPAGVDSKHTIRIMKERLYCGLTSFRISKNSPFKRYANNFIRRFMENGLYDKHLEWIRRLNSDVFQVNKYKTTSTAPVILSLDIISGVFVFYIVGVSIAVIVFIFEMLPSIIGIA